MKRRGHISPFICLLIVTFALTAATEVCAQDFMQPPFAPMPRVAMPSLMGGRFYIQAGAQYRSLQSLQFNAFGGSETLTVASGTIFGPSTAGNFGVGTGKTGFVGDSCPLGTSWIYQNGVISSAVIADGNPAIPVECLYTDPITGTQSVIVCNLGMDTCWTDSVITPQLGRYVTSSANLANCCTGNAPVSDGSFIIDDPTTQVSNPGSITGTTTVTFEQVVPGSVLYVLGAIPDINKEIGPTVWSPVLTFGYQAGDFFDVFSGFSWFNVNNSMGYTVVIQGEGARRLVRDTFPFISDDDSGWPPGNGAAFSFNSSNTIVGGNALHSYKISPNRAANGIYPNREFLTQLDNTTVNFRQTVSASADISVYESRYGGRSWVPLYGLGSLGVYTGFSFMPAYYKITENRSYVKLDDGQTFLAVSAYHTDWRPHYGGFVGGDLALAFGPVYVNGSIDYTWASEQSYRLDVVETNFRPGGLTAGVAGGIRF